MARRPRRSRPSQASAPAPRAVVETTRGQHVAALDQREQQSWCRRGRWPGPDALIGRDLVMRVARPDGVGEPGGDVLGPGDGRTDHHRRAPRRPARPATCVDGAVAALGEHRPAEARQRRAPDRCPDPPAPARPCSPTGWCRRCRRRRAARRRRRRARRSPPWRARPACARGGRSRPTGSGRGAPGGVEGDDVGAGLGTARATSCDTRA